MGMKHHKSFRQYLAERNVMIFDGISSGARILSEAVLGQAKQFWPNFTLADIIKISFFSDDWTSDSVFGKLSGKFPVASVEKLEEAALGAKWLKAHRFSMKYRNQELTKYADGKAKVSVDREQLIVNYQGDDWKKVDEIIKAALAGNEESFAYDEPVVKVPPPDTYTQGEFGFMKDLKEASKVTSSTFKVSPKEGCPAEKTAEVLGKLEASLKELGKAAKARRVKPSGEIDITVSGTVVDLIQASAILGGYTQFFWKNASMSEQTANPVKTLSSLPEGMDPDAAKGIMAAFKKQFDFTSDLGVTQKWLLNFAYGSIYKKRKKMSPEEIDAVVKKAEAEGHPIPADQVEQMRLKQMSKDEVEALAVKECWDSGKTKEVLASLPNPEFKDVDEFCDYFKKNHLEQQLGNFSEIWRKQRATLNAAKVKFMEDAEASDEEWTKDRKEVEKRLTQVENDVKSSWALKLELPQVKNLWQLQGIIDWHGSVEEIQAKAGKAKEIVQAKPEHKTSGSERRMKLFYAAQHADPNTEIVQTADWVVAVCRSAKATAPFGRLKPKVVKGTNDVDPKCNLEDWEGIGADEKKWRDDPTMDASAYVRDGVTDEHGHNFDTILGEHGQTTVHNAHIFCETAWCFTGVLGGHWGWSELHGSSDFNKYSESGTRPVLIMMDTKRGALYAYAHFRSGGQELENFLNENEKCDGDPKNGTDPSDSRQKEFLEKFKASHQSFNALLAQLNRKYYPDFNVEIDDEVGYDDYKPGEVKNAVAASGAHPAAIRRLKLFQAAEHWGATIIKTPKWVIGVCAGNQMQPFGRYKPIASKEDPSKPDPKYNLEDWEGIGADEKKVRDRDASDHYAKFDCVKDGITDGYGIKYDHLEGHSGQGSLVRYAESCWCVCGALNNENFPWGKHAFKYGGFDSYTQGSGGKAFVCMDMSRGAMYLWTVGSDGSDNIANERDSMDSFQMTTANSGSKQATWFKNNFLPSHPELQVLINKLKKKYGGKVSYSSSQVVLTPEQLYKQAAADGKVSPNGTLTLKSLSDAQKYKAIFGKFQRIAVDAQNCDGMFKAADLTNVRQIDFGGTATSMNETFRDAQVDVIDIAGTYNVTSFARCFMGARLEQLTGLDTSSAETITQMFFRSKASKNGKLRLPPFDLRSCHCIDGAFSNTNVQNVKLENTDGVTSAVDCYTYCPYLVNYPQTIFPKIRDMKRLTAGEAYIDMFAGCDQLMNSGLATGTEKKADFDELLKQTEDYYGKRDTDEYFDEDGYFRVDGEDSLRTQYYEKNARKISKIRVYVSPGTNLFNGVDVYAKEIDLNGIDNASLMFYEARFRRVPTLTGCENVTDASNMFSGCLFAIAPNLDLPSVKGFKNIFSDCANLHQLPKMTVGKGFAGDLSAFDGLEYVFGGEGHYEGAAANCGKPRLEKFCKTLREQIIGDVEVPGKKAGGDEGKEYFEPRTSEIETAYGDVKSFLEKLSYSGKKPDIKKLIVDTDPGNMFGDFHAGSDLFPIEFDEAKMAEHPHWQPHVMFVKSDLKSIRFLNWPETFVSANAMFENAYVKDGIPEFDMSKIRNATNMFCGCKTDKPMEKVPELPSLETGSGMFKDSHKVLPAAGFKLSEMKLGEKLKQAECMFESVAEPIEVDWFACGAEKVGGMFAKARVTSVGAVRLPAAVDCQSMFSGCEQLETVGAFSTTGSAAACFANCAGLVSAVYIDIPNQSDMSYMFMGCKKLTNIAWYNLNKGGSTADMFKDSPLAGLFGSSMEKYKASKYVQKVPEKVKNAFAKSAAE